MLLSTCQYVSRVSIKHSDQSSLAAGSGHLGPLHIESEHRETGVMSCYVQSWAVTGQQINYLDVASLGGRHGQHTLLTAGAQTHQTPGVGAGVEDVELGGVAGEGEHLNQTNQRLVFLCVNQSEMSIVMYQPIKKIV